MPFHEEPVVMQSKSGRKQFHVLLRTEGGFYAKLTETPAGRRSVVFNDFSLRMVSHGLGTTDPKPKPEELQAIVDYLTDHDDVFTEWSKAQDHVDVREVLPEREGPEYRR